MIKITPEAAKQIQVSTQQGKTEDLALRIAASKNDDGSIHYGMGFDEKKDDDITITSEGINVIVSPLSSSLLKDTTLDFVELEPGKKQFIFMNPNDPSYSPPSDD